ncbi:MAG: hypothetical protein HZB59_06950 [Ignavibacteriales bacterium]|nr:hypothetical protein [Ignavibacteriales bacterium]
MPFSSTIHTTIYWQCKSILGVLDAWKLSVDYRQYIQKQIYWREPLRKKVQNRNISLTSALTGRVAPYGALYEWQHLSITPLELAQMKTLCTLICSQD